MNYNFKLKVPITLLSLISIIFPIDVANAHESDNYAYNAIGQYGKLGSSNDGYEYKFTDAPGTGDNPGVTYIGAFDPEKTTSNSNQISLPVVKNNTDKVNCDDSGIIWNANKTILWNQAGFTKIYNNCKEHNNFKLEGYDYITKIRKDQGTLNLSLSSLSTNYPFSQTLTLSITGGSGSGNVTYSVSNGTATGCSLIFSTLTANTAGTCLIVASKAQDEDYKYTDSSAVSFTFSALAPDAVTSLTVTPGNTTCTLSWTAGSANGSDITDYTIEYSTDGTNYTTFADGTSTATTATVTGLANLTVYTLRVTAVNSIGSGSSTTVSCTPTA